MKLPLYTPLLDTYRSGYIDTRFYGMAFLFDKKGLIKSRGEDNGAKFYLRSLFKPIQASVLDEKIISHFNFTDCELAVMQGSHAGEKCHTDAVLSILKKTGLNEDDLLCPAIAPLNTGLSKGNFSKIHNNCSGKHTMMLAFCKYNNLDTKSYTDFYHPVQEAIRKKLLGYAQTNDFIFTKDGCTAPVYGLSMENIAKSFLNYYDDIKNSRLINAFKNNPYLAGGEDDFSRRTDTKIMEFPYGLISKVGAGGFIYIYNAEKKQILIIKMSQDNNRAREMIALSVLHQIGWSDKAHYDENIYTENGEPVGKIKVIEF